MEVKAEMFLESVFHRRFEVCMVGQACNPNTQQRPALYMRYCLQKQASKHFIN